MKALFKCMETNMNRLRGRLNWTPVDFSFQRDEEDSETDTDRELEENQESEEDVPSSETQEGEAGDPAVLD